MGNFINKTQDDFTIEDKPNYYAVIPANVRYADINANAKLLYGEITALCNKEGYCWATNAYFAKLYNVSTNSISTWIQILKNEGFINVEITPAKIGFEVSRKLWIPHQVNLETPPRKLGSNNKYNNTITNVIAETPKRYGRNLPVASLVAKAQEYGFTANGEMEGRAAKRLITKYTYLTVMDSLKKSQELRRVEYAPQILSLQDLETKWAKLQDYFLSQNKPEPKKGIQF